jgi:hypothetical protein
MRKETLLETRLAFALSSEVALGEEARSCGAGQGPANLRLDVAHPWNRDLQPFADPELARGLDPAPIVRKIAQLDRFPTAVAAPHDRIDLDRMALPFALCHTMHSHAPHSAQAELWQPALNQQLIGKSDALGSAQAAMS